MQGLLILIVGKVVEVVLKYLIAWGEKSMAKQDALKKKMEAYRAAKTQAERKAEEYEKAPSDATRNNLP